MAEMTSGTEATTSVFTCPISASHASRRLALVLKQKTLKTFGCPHNNNGQKSGVLWQTLRKDTQAILLGQVWNSI